MKTTKQTKQTKQIEDLTTYEVEDVLLACIKNIDNQYDTESLRQRDQVKRVEDVLNNMLCGYFGLESTRQRYNKDTGRPIKKNCSSQFDIVRQEVNSYEVSMTKVAECNREFYLESIMGCPKSDEEIIDIIESDLDSLLAKAKVQGSA